MPSVSLDYFLKASGITDLLFTDGVIASIGNRILICGYQILLLFRVSVLLWALHVVRLLVHAGLCWAQSDLGTGMELCLFSTPRF